MSNFAYLKQWQVFGEILRSCTDAEKSIAISNAACALQTRRALEIAVKWMFRHDKDLTVPYQEGLSSLIHDSAFNKLVDPGLHKRIRFIISMGNKAAHTAKNMQRDHSIECLRNMYDFVRWIVYSYAKHNHTTLFDSQLLDDGDAVERRSKAMQEEMAAKEAQWDAKRKKLTDELKDATERQQYADIREESQKAKNFDCDTLGEMSEWTTRKIYIDHALEMMGWEIGNNCSCIEEVEVSGMPSDSGIGYVDYVLYADNGDPLAVIEAKRTSKDPKIGKQQAKLYADCLEQKHGVRPLIYYTNGFTSYFWDDVHAPERLVFGFFTKDELDSYNYQAQNRQTITTVTCDNAIADRVYQKKAIQAVCTNIQKGHRKSLLVMATGSGKTRTAVSIVEVLQRYGWVKNVLFLADRRELVKQAKNDFSALMPELSTCNLLENTKKTENSPTARMIFSTYATIMNAIDNTKSDDGSQLFTTGHFDLIIVDEAHRSIYKKYQDIFTYFDSYLLGLTATPRDEIDKNTYDIFDLENGVPTETYELDQAINEGYLVDYHSIESTLKLVDEGIHYDELSAEEQRHWEDVIDEDIKDISGQALNKKLFNTDTVDAVLHQVMTDGIFVQGGDVIGKTIIFAANTKHADFILKRFNIRYPQYPSAAATIYNSIKYVGDLIDELKKKDEHPRIGISVDMLDTGINIPELVNLVFFKRIRSITKFRQMIGRGTRLCKDLFGPDLHKDQFLIFDYCGNFEYFRVNAHGIESNVVKSLSENLFNIRTRIAQLLQHSDHQSDPLIAYRATLISDLHAGVCTIDEDNFSARMRIEYIHRYNQKEAWTSISDHMIHEIEQEIAALSPNITDDELAKRFDFLMFTIEEAYLRGEAAIKAVNKVIVTAAQLENVGHLPQVKRHAKLITDVQNDDFWSNANLFSHEKVREAFRDLIQLLEKGDTIIYYTSFSDSIVDTQVHSGMHGSDDYDNYRKKVNNYLNEHQDDLAVFKLRHNKSLSEGDIQHLEQLLWEKLGTKADYTHNFGEEPLLTLVASIVGLDIKAANELFSTFISDQSLNSEQLEFISLIVNHIVANGSIDKEIFSDHPFNKFGNITLLFNEKIETAQGIIKCIDDLNGRLSV